MNNKATLEVLKNLYLKSSEKIKAARELYNLKLFDDSASRSYYSVFHILSALLFTKGLTYSSHKEVISNFNIEFIRTAIFPKDFSKKIAWLFRSRQTGDYDSIKAIDKETAELCLQYAKEIIDTCMKNLSDKYNVKDGYWDS